MRSINNDYLYHLGFFYDVSLLLLIVYVIGFVYA